jgi:hypothetical protein
VEFSKDGHPNYLPYHKQSLIDLNFTEVGDLKVDSEKLIVDSFVQFLKQ